MLGAGLTGGFLKKAGSLCISQKVTDALKQGERRMPSSFVNRAGFKKKEILEGMCITIEAALDAKRGRHHPS